MTGPAADAAIDNEAIWNRLDDHHPGLGPVAEQTMDRLLTQAGLGGRARILDIGCGLGAWLLRALELYPDARGVGVDLSPAHVAKAHRGAERRGLAARFDARACDARALAADDGYDLVMCIGLSEAFGGTRATLERLIRPRLHDAGAVLLGEPFWQRPPDGPALAGLGGVDPERYPHMDALYDTVTASGWVPVHAHVSSEAEWDGFMWACVRALVDWGRGERDPVERGRILRFMADYRDAWLQGYRGTLGFVTMLLTPVSLAEVPLTGRRPVWAPSPWVACRGTPDAADGDI